MLPCYLEIWSSLNRILQRIAKSTMPTKHAIEPCVKRSTVNASWRRHVNRTEKKKLNKCVTVWPANRTQSHTLFTDHKSHTGIVGSYASDVARRLRLLLLLFYSPSLLLGRSLSRILRLFFLLWCAFFAHFAVFALANIYAFPIVLYFCLAWLGSAQRLRQRFDQN